MKVYDLHTHSTTSDGVLEPSVLLARASAKGVDTLALTDHDSVDGITEARMAAAAEGIQLISGVEISVGWHGHLFHIVGLDIDESMPIRLTQVPVLTGGRRTSHRGRSAGSSRLGVSLTCAGSCPR